MGYNTRIPYIDSSWNFLRGYTRWSPGRKHSYAGRVRQSVCGYPRTDCNLNLLLPETDSRLRTYRLARSGWMARPDQLSKKYEQQILTVSAMKSMNAVP